MIKGKALYSSIVYNHMDTIYDSIKKLRDGVIFALLGVPIYLLAVFLLIVGIFMAPTSLNSASLIIGISVLAIAIIAIGLTRLYNGFVGLTPYMNNVGLGKIGTLLLVIPVVNAFATILIGVALYQVGEKFQNGLVKIGGILGAIPLGITTLVGFLLAYEGLGQLLKEFERKSK